MSVSNMAAAMEEKEGLDSSTGRHTEPTGRHTEPSAVIAVEARESTMITSKHRDGPTFVLAPSGDSPTQQQPLLEFVLMVKNGATTVVAVLEKIRQCCDHWTVLDTGSTDGTQELIRQFAVTHQFPGQLFEEPFRTFAVSRNRALELAGQRCVFTLMLDDSYVVSDPPALRAYLEARRSTDEIGFAMMLHYYTSHLLQPWILRTTSVHCRYQFPVHETLIPGLSHSIPDSVCHLTDLSTRETLERSSTRRKQDLAMLDAYLVDHPECSRSHFYRARTLDCLDRRVEAVVAYERRARLKDRGYEEEIYICRLSQYRHVQSETYPDDRSKFRWHRDALPYLLEAIAVDADRCEAYYEIGKHYHLGLGWGAATQDEGKNYAIADAWLQLGIRQRPRFAHRRIPLFHEKDVFDYHLPEMYIRNGTWLSYDQDRFLNFSLTLPTSTLTKTQEQHLLSHQSFLRKRQAARPIVVAVPRSLEPSSSSSGPPVRLLHLVLTSPSPEYSAMQEATWPYYRSRPAEEGQTWYYAYDETMEASASPRVDLETGTLWFPGRESLVPGTIDKTLAALRWCEPWLGGFTHVLRSNVSTVVDWEQLRAAIAHTPPPAYSGSFINVLNWLDPPAGLHDHRWRGLPFVSGTGILFRADAIRWLLAHESQIDRTLVDDVALGVAMRERAADEEVTTVGSIDWTPDHVHSASFYRCKTQDRQDDVSLITTLVAELLARDADMSDVTVVAESANAESAVAEPEVA